jgi:hypothetical protein
MFMALFKSGSGLAVIGGESYFHPAWTIMFISG